MDRIARDRVHFEKPEWSSMYFSRRFFIRRFSSWKRLFGRTDGWGFFFTIFQLPTLRFWCFSEVSTSFRCFWTPSDGFGWKKTTKHAFDRRQIALFRLQSSNSTTVTPNACQSVRGTHEKCSLGRHTDTAEMTSFNGTRNRGWRLKLASVSSFVGTGLPHVCIDYAYIIADAHCYYCLFFFFYRLYGLKYSSSRFRVVRPLCRYLS